jgi:hypothetical protein
MELLTSRTYPFIDSQSLVIRQAHDSLFRMQDGAFLLHLSSSDKSTDEDQLIWLDSRAALIWINEAPDEFGIEWQ